MADRTGPNLSGANAIELSQRLPEQNRERTAPIGFLSEADSERDVS
jgi:hypothetical protein